MDTKVLLAIALSLIAVFAYQEFVLKRLYPPQTQAARPRQSARSASSEWATPTVTAEARLPASTPSSSPLAAPSHKSLVSASGAERAQRTITVETSLFTAVFTSRGARLLHFRLKQFRETAAAESPPLEMVKPAPGGALPMGLVLSHAGALRDDREVNYETAAPARIDVGPKGHPVITFDAVIRDGLKLEKTFSFEDSDYVFQVNARVAGATAGIGAVGLAMSQPLTAHTGYEDIPELQAYVNGKTLTEAEKALKKGVIPVSGPIGYAGFGDRYFLAAFMPQSPPSGTLVMDFDGAEANVQMLFPATAGGEFDIASRVYMGPKELNILEAANPLLSKAIDFGWTGILALVFLRALKLFHFISPNYGVDIILLTVAIRVVFLPMSIKSQRSMMRMQRLQPQMERLREKFKSDKAKLNHEMMDLYKRNHVNPLGGCAPMALQLPIFLGLYEALLNAVELRHAPFLGWINDLSAPDCLPIPHMPVVPFIDCAGIPVLVLLMGVSTFIQQWMSPKAADPTQQRMMMLSPIIFTVMLVKFPAGLSLYYFASNLLGIVQQFFLNREFKQVSPVTA